MINMEKDCRLCGSSNDAILYNLFDPDQNYLHYVKKIHKLLPIAVNEFDPLPKTICHRCAFKISEFYEFRINCIRAQEYLKTKLPWCNPNQEQPDTSVQHIPMVEVQMNSIEHFSPAEKYQTNSIFKQDDGLIVIDDDDNLGSNEDDNEEMSNITESSFEQPKDERNTFQVEGQSNTSRLVMKIKKNSPMKRSAIWSAKNSNHFGKRKKRKKKSCKIDHIFSTPTSVYQNMGQLDIIDPTEYISAQEQGNAVGTIKKTKEDPLKVQSDTHEPEESEDDVSDNESRLPSCILVTKIPNVGFAYTCKICRRTFLGAESAVTHDCDDVAVQQKKKSHLPNHVAEKKPEQPEITKNNYSNHNRTEPSALTTNNNDSEDVYICDICNKVFPRQVILLAHKRQHFVTYSSTDSELETSKTKRHCKRNYKRMDRQKKRLDNGTAPLSEGLQNEELNYV